MIIFVFKFDLLTSLSTIFFNNLSLSISLSLSLFSFFYFVPSFLSFSLSGINFNIFLFKGTVNVICSEISTKKFLSWFTILSFKPASENYIVVIIKQNKDGSIILVWTKVSRGYSDVNLKLLNYNYLLTWDLIQTLTFVPELLATLYFGENSLYAPPPVPFPASS